MTPRRRTSTSTSTGMTCASCAARIEKRLNRLDGVTATVNFATEQAAVDYDPDARGAGRAGRRRRGHRLRRAAAGRRAAGRRAGGHAGPGGHARRPRAGDLAALRRRLVVSAVLTVPVLLMAMVPALQFRGWQWLSLALTIPVVMWGGLAVPPCRVDQPAPRRGDDGHPHLARRAGRVRLVALGAVLRRRRRARHDDAVLADEPVGRERATTSTSRSPRRSPCSSSPGATSRPGPSAAPGAALRALLELGAKDVAVLRDGRSSASPIDRPRASATGSSSAPARRWPPTAWSRTAPRRSTHRMLTGESVPVEVGPGDRGRRCDRQRGRSPRRPRPPGSAPTRSWPRSRGWSSRPRPARRPCNGSPTGCRPCSCPIVILLAAATLVFWLVRSGDVGGRVQRRGGRADHRLPVRAGAGHADRAAGGHRPGRPARAS